MTEYLYRYEDEWFGGDTEPHIRLWKFPVVARTPCTVVIHTWGRDRRVTLGARASFAKRTIAEAKESFLIRKSHAKSYAQWRAQKAQACLDKLNDDEAWAKIDAKPCVSGRAPLDVD